MILEELRQSKRIAENPRLKHREAIAFFNALIIDLKLAYWANTPREPINMERLEKATALLGTLEECRIQTIFR